MPEQSNLQRMADDNYNSYYDPYYDYTYYYTTDYIIWGSIAGAIIIGAATFFHFMIKRRRNRARRAQLTTVFLASNRFQSGTTAHQAPGMVAGQGLPPPAYAYYPPQGQQVYAIPAQPGIMMGAGHQHQPIYPPGTALPPALVVHN